MMRKFFIFAVVTLINSAQASDVPQGSKFDTRIQHVNYNPGDVVIVRSLVGIGSRIVFSADETILDVASGFTQGWEFSNRRNILYIKPKSVSLGQGVAPMEPESGKWNTNLMVTTNLRMYDIDLHLLPTKTDKAANHVAYRVEYQYPNEELATAQAIEARQRAEERMNSKPAPRNWNYSMQVGDDSENIAPTMAYDDGRFTYLKFPNNRDFPTAFLVAPDKGETLVNSHIDAANPDTLVIHRVAKEVLLRLGNAVVGVYNDSFDADGTAVEQGTTVPGVARVLKGEKISPSTPKLSEVYAIGEVQKQNSATSAQGMTSSGVEKIEQYIDSQRSADTTNRKVWHLGDAKDLKTLITTWARRDGRAVNWSIPETYPLAGRVNPGWAYRGEFKAALGHLAVAYGRFDNPFSLTFSGRDLIVKPVTTPNKSKPSPK